MSSAMWSNRIFFTAVKFWLQYERLNYCYPDDNHLRLLGVNFFQNLLSLDIRAAVLNRELAVASFMLNKEICNGIRVVSIRISASHLGVRGSK